MEEKIYLWPGEAPYTADSPDQAQPSLTAFPVEGARGAVVVCPGGGYCMKADHEGAPIARMLRETPSRVPFSDWYDTKTGVYEHFIARSVQGGVFAPMLR